LRALQQVHRPMTEGRVYALLLVVLAAIILVQAYDWWRS
jgi:hypothetical protein